MTNILTGIIARILRGTVVAWYSRARLNPMFSMRSIFVESDMNQREFDAKEFRPDEIIQHIADSLAIIGVRN